MGTARGRATVLFAWQEHGLRSGLMYNLRGLLADGLRDGICDAGIQFSGVMGINDDETREKAVVGTDWVMCWGGEHRLSLHRRASR